MKILHLTTAYVLCLGALTAQETATKIPAPPGLQEIQREEMKAWIDYLASDELGGRLTGSPGQKLAAEFVVKHFQKLGLEPLGDAGKGSYYQMYAVTRTGLDDKASVQWKGRKGPAKTGFAVIPATKSKKLAARGEFVYAGLIGTRKFRAGVELESWKGKIPVLVVDTPAVGRKLSIGQQMGMGMFLLGALKRRVEKFAQAGAKTVVFCVLDDESAATNVLATMSIAPGQDSLVRGKSHGMMRQAQARVPSIYLSKALSTELLEAIGLGAQEATAAVDADKVGKLKRPKGSIKLDVVTKKSEASNVCAVLRGSDPKLASEAIVFSAHMDHIGKRMDGDAFNGADDNASGTTGLMAIAKAFAKGGKPPRRSVIFLAVSGEELGLWGSAYYADHPTWPVGKIVADVNTDMIGRSGPESGAKQITVTPSYKHQKFSTIVRDAAAIAEQMGFEFTNGDKYYARSDHINFAKKGIPVVFFCNGEHEDYHQASDHPDKIDFEKMESIARLAYWTGFLVAEADRRPADLGRSKGWRDSGQ